MQLQRGDVAVVTGAASGIGFAMAERFASSGLHVVAADVDPVALGDAVTRLAEHGGEVLGHPTDVSREEEVQALAAATLERFGGVHVVCNNAGVAAQSDAWFGPLSSWEWVIGVNLWGVIHGVRTFLPHLALGGGGHIVITASIAGLVPGFSPSYDATKHAVVAITEDLYVAMRDAGAPVGVSVLCPGWVRTQIFDSERNWPAHLGEVPERSLAAQVMQPHLRRAIDEGLTPAAVADVVARGIEEDRFWLFPHPDWVSFATDRWAGIAEGANPEPVDALPGMPPRAQMVEEVVAAFAALSEG
jgi:NAD(P)-dependent dehydrogenase (short-subunit alcohol dehydrogenase family)